MNMYVTYSEAGDIESASTYVPEQPYIIVSKETWDTLKDLRYAKVDIATKKIVYDSDEINKKTISTEIANIDSRIRMIEGAHSRQLREVALGIATDVTINRLSSDNKKIEELRMKRAGLVEQLKKLTQ